MTLIFLFTSAVLPASSSTFAVLKEGFQAFCAFFSLTWQSVEMGMMIVFLAGTRLRKGYAPLGFPERERATPKS